MFELKIEKHAKPERVRLTQDHIGSEVKAIVWDSTGSKVFVGDGNGKITIISVPSNKVNDALKLYLC